MPAYVLLLAAVPLAWWLPNHYYPWLAAWPEGLALALLCVAGMLSPGRGTIARPWVVAIGIAALSVGIQFATGLILFGGDALMVLVYLAAFAGALAAGAAMSRATTESGCWNAVDTLALGTLVAALGSVTLALLQWTGVGGFDLYVVPIRPGSRPSANVAQANHFCTIAFLGLCSLGVLREGDRLGRTGYAVAAGFLVLGMAMSGSRTGWVQALGLLVAVAAWQQRAAMKIRLAQAMALLGAFAAAVVAWPVVNAGLLLSGGRGVGEQIDGGTRLPMWKAMLDAIAREPWTGYGWQQVAIAQQAVALDHPPIQRHFEHSHNVLIDLALWAGLPVAALVIGATGLALARQLRAVADGRRAWLMIGVVGLLVHGLLEYPLEYAYFLVPVGLALGAAHGLSSGQPEWRVPNPLLRVGCGALALLLGAISIDYLAAEQSHRILRLEDARIGTTGIETPTPELPLLTQLGAYLTMARTPARSGMSHDEVEAMRRAAQRWAYPPMMLRFALAAGLNGDPEAARLTLLRICSMHLRTRCEEARESWASAQQRYPELRAVPQP